MLPSVAQAKLPIEYRQRSGPAGSPNGGYPPYLTAPGHTLPMAAVGSVLGLERLDIVRHSVTPAHVKTLNGQISSVYGASGWAQPILPCRPGNADKKHSLSRGDFFYPIHPGTSRHFHIFFVWSVNVVRVRNLLPLDVGTVQPYKCTARQQHARLFFEALKQLVLPVALLQLCAFFQEFQCPQ